MVFSCVSRGKGFLRFATSANLHDFGLTQTRIVVKYPMSTKEERLDTERHWTDADAREDRRKRGLGRRDPSHWSQDDSEGYDGGEHHDLDL